MLSWGSSGLVSTALNVVYWFRNLVFDLMAGFSELSCYRDIGRVTLVYSSCRTGNRTGDKASGFEASLFTTGVLVGSSNSRADRISIVELRVAINVVILFDSTTGFTCFLLVVKLILSASLAICETIYRPFLILASINGTLSLRLEKSI